MFLTLMFCGLGALMALEFLNTYARVIGVQKGSLSIGITVQNSLSVIARAVSAVTLPTISLYADLGLFKQHTFTEIAIANASIFVLLLATYSIRRRVTNVFAFMVAEIQRTGRLRVGYLRTSWKERRKKLPMLTSLHRAFLLAYIALYLAWPLTIALLKYFPDYRATVISSATVLTGINTLIITMLIDPKIAFLAKYKRVATEALVHQVRIKLYACAVVTSSVIILGIVLDHM
jgi:hypothetical protein